MHWITKDIGGEVAWYAPQRPDAGPTVEVRDRSGTVVPAATAATIENVNRTLAVGCEAGAESLQLDAAPTLRSRGRYRLGGDRPEVVQVRNVSGTTVYLQYPTAYDHSLGDAFQSTRVSYTVSAAAAASPGDNWRAVFSYALSGVAQPPHTVEFGVALNWFGNPCTLLTLRRLEPNIVANMPAEADFDDICERAFDEVSERLTARGVHIYDYLGSDKLERACGYMGLFLCAELYGQAFRDERERLSRRAEAALTLFAAVTPTDEDRDGVVSPYERSGPTSLRIRRRS